MRAAIDNLLSVVLLVLGVTLIGFLLMVYFGPDQTYQHTSKNPTPEEIAAIRTQLGYDQPLPVRYLTYLKELATLDFGFSDATGEQVTTILERTVPVSAALLLPGFVLGQLLALVLAGIAAFNQGRSLDRAIMGLAVAGMSISFLVVIIAFQVVFASRYGLNWFPARGWDASSASAYLRHIAVPTLAIVFVSTGYNTRFYRSLFVEELGRDYVRTARAFGFSRPRIFLLGVLRNSLLPIMTRVLYSIPMLLVGGSLILEGYFGIPGVGKVTYDAMTSGDQPVLKAVIGLASVVLAAITLLAERLYTFADPRIR